MKTFEQMKAEWKDDRARLTSKCAHEWECIERESGSRLVLCVRCAKRPHCAGSIFDSRRRSLSTHAQGETEREALFKAAILLGLSGERAEPIICPQCGYWTLP